MEIPNYQKDMYFWFNQFENLAGEVVRFIKTNTDIKLKLQINVSSQSRLSLLLL